MKQLVCEKWSGNNVKISLKYPKKCKFFFLLKEREETRMISGGKLVKIYWIEVANNPVKIENSNEKCLTNQLSRVQLKSQKRIAKKRDLHKLKEKRMERYAELVKMGREIIPTSQEIADGMALSEMIGRKIKAPSFLKLN